MWLEAKKTPEFNIDTNITVLNTVWNLKNNINKTTNWVLLTKSCKWFCEKISDKNKNTTEICGREWGCRNSENYDDGLNINFTI